MPITNPIYKATKGGKVQAWQVEIEGNKYRSISGQTDGQKVVSEWTVCQGKNIGRSNETTPNEQAEKEAMAKRKIKIEHGYYESDHVGELKAKFYEPMLAQNWDDWCTKINYPLYSQPKLDGVRCIVKKEGMFTRTGKPLLSAPHIHTDLRFILNQNPNLIFDGELYADKFANDFNAIVSLVKKTKPTPMDLELSQANIEYHIYDLPSVDKIFSERMNELQKIKLPKCCKVVTTTLVNNEKEVNEANITYLDQGYEGQILRVDNVYENKRSKFLLKRKTFVDEEYEILDICEGEGNKTGQVGYMVFEREGKRFKSNVKCTWKEGAEIFKNRNALLGKTATVKYFNLTPDGVPRFPYVIKIDRYAYE